MKEQKEANKMEEKVQFTFMYDYDKYILKVKILGLTYEVYNAAIGLFTPHNVAELLRDAADSIDSYNGICKHCNRPFNH
jgi:hypothetical protein